LKSDKSKDGAVVQNLRDEFDTDELATIMFAEVAAKKDIKNRNRQGNKQCADSCYNTAKKVASVLA